MWLNFSVCSLKEKKQVVVLLKVSFLPELGCFILFPLHLFVPLSSHLCGKSSPSSPFVLFFVQGLREFKPIISPFLLMWSLSNVAALPEVLHFFCFNLSLNKSIFFILCAFSSFFFSFSLRLLDSTR